MQSREIASRQTAHKDLRTRGAERQSRPALKLFIIIFVLLLVAAVVVVVVVIIIMLAKNLHKLY